MVEPIKLTGEEGEIEPGLRWILTPGHCNGLISILVDTDDGLVVIASDCVGPLPEYFDQMDLPEDFGAERDELLEQWERIRDARPLHGDPRAQPACRAGLAARLGAGSKPKTGSKGKRTGKQRGFRDVPPRRARRSTRHNIERTIDWYICSQVEWLGRIGAEHARHAMFPSRYRAEPAAKAPGPGRASTSRAVSSAPHFAHVRCSVTSPPQPRWTISRGGPSSA